MDESRAAAFAAYVESGGTLVLAPRAAVKDRCNAVPERPVPAWLDELAGLEVTDFVSLEAEHSVPVDGGSFHGWYEELTLRGASALASYADGRFAGGAAIAEHATGEGTTVYVGGVADAATLQGLYRTIADRIGLALLKLPQLVEVVPLANDHEDLLVVLNHSDEERTVQLAPGRWQAYLGDGGEGTVTLPPFGVALLGQETMPSRPAAAVADADR
jgi:beta-galactosidase